VAAYPEGALLLEYKEIGYLISSRFLYIFIFLFVYLTGSISGDATAPFLLYMQEQGDGSSAF